MGGGGFVWVNAPRGSKALLRTECVSVSGRVSESESVSHVVGVSNRYGVVFCDSDSQPKADIRPISNANGYAVYDRISKRLGDAVFIADCIALLDDELDCICNTNGVVQTNPYHECNPEPLWLANGYAD